MGQVAVKWNLILQTSLSSKICALVRSQAMGFQAMITCRELWGKVYIKMKQKWDCKISEISDYAADQRPFLKAHLTNPFNQTGLRFKKISGVYHHCFSRKLRKKGAYCRETFRNGFCLMEYHQEMDRKPIIFLKKLYQQKLCQLRMKGLKTE